MFDSKLIKENIDEYLDRHEKKELLRFVTVGSVDDGKSTLIGRLLHDTNSVYEDQLASAKKSTKQDIKGEIDFSLLTDGLKAEREQGITIDVAYRYFTTDKRKFIIADTPGHVQYTRNMATGASTADVAIILIDARLGVLAQSKRHAFIASLLGISNLVVGVNKMDLKNYDEKVFNSIVHDFKKFSQVLKFKEVAFFPISALNGDNVASKSELTPWFKGNSILNYLETVSIPKHNNLNEFCLPIQYVIRPDLNFRGYAGQIASGKISIGDEVVVLPSGKKSKVKEIISKDKKITSIEAPLSTTLTLEDEIDISRGDILSNPKNKLHIARSLTAWLVWMNEKPLKTGHQYLFKHTTNMMTGVINKVHHVIDVETLNHVKADNFQLNDIGKVSITLSRPLVIDLYSHSRQAGSFIIIDRLTNATVACGMIEDFDKESSQDAKAVASGVTSLERAHRFHQKPCVVTIIGQPGSGKIILARAIERRLFESGYLPIAIDPEIHKHLNRNATKKDVAEIIKAIKLTTDSGLIALCPFSLPQQKDREKISENVSVPIIEIHVFADTKVRKERLTNLERDLENAEMKFEIPQNCDLSINTSQMNLELEVDRVVEMMRKKGVLA